MLWVYNACRKKAGNPSKGEVMLYSSFGDLKSRPRGSILKFCELVLEASPNALHAKTLQETIEKTRENETDSSWRFGVFTEIIRSFICASYIQAVDQHVRRYGGTPKRIEVLENRKKGGCRKGRLNSIQVLYPTSERTGICLTFFGDRHSQLSFRVSKLFMAKKLAGMAELSEPTPTTDWPQISITPSEPKEQKFNVSVVYLAGVEVPFGEVVALIQKYRK